LIRCWEAAEVVVWVLVEVGLSWVCVVMAGNMGVVVG
jgi:hypothetical protein